MDMQRIERQRVELVDYDAEYGPEADRVADLAGEGGGSAPTLEVPTPGPSREREGSRSRNMVPLPPAGNRRCGAATAVRGGRAEGTEAGPSNPSTQPITPDQRRRALDAALALVLADEGEDDAPDKPQGRSGPEPLLDPALQATFCEHLAIHGNARLACRAVKVSPTTAYRVRRQDATFRRLWNAALVIARDQVEDVLADRAVNGWEEAVFYHGEEVAVRRRYDSRLLLAHLARLDRLAGQDDMAPVVEQFDDALEMMKAGEVPALPEAAPAPAPAAAPVAAVAGSVAEEPVPLLEARLRWLEARHGRLSVAEETFHLQNTVPRVPGSALWPHGWRGPDVLDGLPNNAVGGVNGVPLWGFGAVGEGLGVSPAARS